MLLSRWLALPLDLKNCSSECHKGGVKYILVLDVRIMRGHVLHDVKILDHENPVQNNLKSSSGQSII
jgi:hypothetical protein